MKSYLDRKGAQSALRKFLATYPESAFAIASPTIVEVDGRWVDGRQVDRRWAVRAAILHADAVAQQSMVEAWQARFGDDSLFVEPVEQETVAAAPVVAEEPVAAAPVEAAAKAVKPWAAKPGTKKWITFDAMSRPEGVSVAELVDLLGWPSNVCYGMANDVKNHAGGTVETTGKGLERRFFWKP